MLILCPKDVIIELEALPKAETTSPKALIVSTEKSPKALTIVSRLVITVLKRLTKLSDKFAIELSILPSQSQRLPVQSEELL